MNLCYLSLHTQYTRIVGSISSVLKKPLDLIRRKIMPFYNKITSHQKLGVQIGKSFDVEQEWALTAFVKDKVTVSFRDKSKQRRNYAFVIPNAKDRLHDK